MTAAAPNPSLLKLKTLPPFPAVALKLMTLLRREDANFREAAELMKIDAALCGEVLRLANSASMNVRFPVSSMLQALSVLGVSRMVSLATALCVGRLLKPVAKLPVMRRVWRLNLATALIASKRAPQASVDSEKAYTFGMLAGIGRLALLVSNPILYEKAVSRAESQRLPLELLERELFGFDHREAGRWLVAEWKLPEEMNAVLFVAAPALSGNAALAFLIRDAIEEAVSLGFGLVAESRTCPPELAASDIVEKVDQIEQELAV